MVSLEVYTFMGVKLTSDRSTAKFCLLVTLEELLG